MYKEATIIPKTIQLDRWLLVSSGVLLLIGMLMVTSASSYIAERYEVSVYHYSIRQLIYISAGLIAGLFAFRISLERWYRLTPFLIFLSFIMLIAVLIPGVGREINGAMRWIPLGVMNFQPSEVVKLFALIYIAGYLQRHNEELKKHMITLIVPLFVLGLLGILLLLEPDFGSTSVLMAVGLGMIFLAGVSLWRFGIVIMLTAGMMIVVLYSAPYRLVRLKTFLNPWDYKFDQGFQLINSLMAIGRGSWSGVGIGESIQKLGYLPEAHTDFIFAIYAEEFGLLGVVFLLFLFSMFLSRAFLIGQRAELCGMRFGSYLCYGIGLWVVGQAFINLSVAMGRLPTKGLTLPLISYGGSSIITIIIAIALLFRVDIDTQYEMQKLNNSRQVTDETKSE